jgi:hypothetical protein
VFLLVTIPLARSVDWLLSPERGSGPRARTGLGPVTVPGPPSGAR